MIHWVSYVHCRSVSSKSTFEKHPWDLCSIDHSRCSIFLKRCRKLRNAFKFCGSHCSSLSLIRLDKWYFKSQNDSISSEISIFSSLFMLHPSSIWTCKGWETSSFRNEMNILQYFYLPQTTVAGNLFYLVDFFYHNLRRSWEVIVFSFFQPAYFPCRSYPNYLSSYVTVTDEPQDHSFEGKRNHFLQSDMERRAWLANIELNQTFCLLISSIALSFSLRDACSDLAIFTERTKNSM